MVSPTRGHDIPPPRRNDSRNQRRNDSVPSLGGSSNDEHYLETIRELQELSRTLQALRIRLQDMPNGKTFDAMLDATYSSEPRNLGELRTRIEKTRAIIDSWEDEREEQRIKEEKELKNTIHAEMTRTMLHESNIPGAIAPPVLFGQHPTLNNVNRVNQANAIFGQRKRFTGEARRDDVSIHELLQDLNEAQEQVVLSEIEFVRKLQHCLTGDPYTVVSEMRKEGSSLSDIYSELTNLFGRRESAPEARKTLKDMNRENHSFNSLSEMFCTVSRLSTIAASDKITPEDQKKVKEYKAAEKLLELIPQSLEPLIKGDLARNVKAQGAELSFLDVKSILRNHAEAINNSLMKRKDSRDYKGKEKNKKDPKRQVRKIEVSPPKPQTAKTTRPPAEQPWKHFHFPNVDLSQGWQNAHAYTGPEQIESQGPRVANLNMWSGANRGDAGAAAVMRNGGNARGLTHGNTQPSRESQPRGDGGNKRPPPRKDNNRQRFERSQYERCSLCMHNDHVMSLCPWFPESQRTPARELCSLCNWQAYHKEEHCLLNPENRRSASFATSGSRQRKN